MAQVKERLRADLTAAMKKKDAFSTGVIRMALAAIGTEEVAGKQARTLTEAEEQAVITREVRKRHDSAQAYTAGNRPELAEKEQREAAFLGDYIPAPIAGEELDKIIAEELAAVPDATVKQMGAIMRAVNARLQGRADGAVVAAKVKAALTPAQPQ